MRKINKIILAVAMVFMVSGCSDEVVEIMRAEPTGINDNLAANIGSGVESFVLNDIYKDLRDSDDNTTATKKIMEIISELELDLLNSPELSALYDKRVDEALAVFTTNEGYYVDGVFSEEVLVRGLRASKYDIVCNGEYGPSYDLVEDLKIDQYLLCDYSDYVEKTLRSEILFDLLQEKYILETVMENDEDFITSKKVRSVEYFKLSRGDDNEALDFMTAAVEKLLNGDTFADLAQDWYDTKLALIDEDYAKISTENDDNFENFYKFVFDGKNYRTLSEGLKEMKREVYREELFDSLILTSETNKANQAISESLLNIILSDTLLETKAVQIGSDYYLVSPLATGTFDEGDSIIYDSAKSNYLFIKVSIINEESSPEMIRDAVELLKENSKTLKDFTTHYLNKYEIDIHDEDLYIYLTEAYPTIFN